MPIAKVMCPACGEQPTDHFRGDPGCNPGCILSPSERNWYAWIVQHEMSDTLHAGGTLTPTRLLTCPREVLFSDFLPYTLHPQFCNIAAVGTKVHEATSRSARHLRGHIFGLDIEGECDNIQPRKDGTWWIDDTKVHTDNTMEWVKKKDKPSLERRVQFSLYKIMFEQERGEVVSRLTASHFSPLYRFSEYFDWGIEEVPAMSEEEIGEVRPLGNPFTVRQLAGFHVNALDSIAKEGLKMAMAMEETPLLDRMDIAAKAIAGSVPAVGREMLKQKGGNSWKCDHCHHRKVCDELG